MATYVTLDGVTNPKRIKISTNAVGASKNYKYLNPAKAGIWDIRIVSDESVVEVIAELVNYSLCASALWSPTMTGVMPVEEVNGVLMLTNLQLMDAIIVMVDTP